MGILSWIIFGALAGWVASMVAGSKRRQGCLVNIIVGMVGAFIGGLLFELVTGRGFHFHFNLSSFIVAVTGAILLLAIIGRTRK